MADETQRPTENPELLECSVCLKEIPKSSVQHDEVNEYVMHFCGIECYSQWKDESATDTE